jgi:hypothetical protein
LIATRPLPGRDIFYFFPHDVPAILETLKATQHCLEEWPESRSCRALLGRYLQRSRRREDA